MCISKRDLNKNFKLQGLVNNSWCKVVAPLNLVQTTKDHLLYLHSYLYVILLFIYMIKMEELIFCVYLTMFSPHKLEIIDWNAILTWRLGTSWTKVLENIKGTNFICNFLGSCGGWWGYNIISISFFSLQTKKALCGLKVNVFSKIWVTKGKMYGRVDHFWIHNGNFFVLVYIAIATCYYVC